MPRKKERRFIEKAKEAWEDAEEKFDDTKDKAEGTIKEHPFTSILIAAAVGAVAGVAASEIIRGLRKKEEKSVLKKLREIF